MLDTPFSPAELAQIRLAAERGISPSPETVRRFVLTTRRSFTASPEKTEKAKTPRMKKPAPDESQITFI